MSKLSNIISGLNPQSLWVKAVITILSLALLAAAVGFGIYQHRSEIKDAVQAAVTARDDYWKKQIAESEAKVQSGLVIGWQKAAIDSAALAGTSEGIFNTLKEVNDANEKTALPDCGVDLSKPGRLWARGKRAH